MGSTKYPGTTIRNVRVSDELWLAAKVKTYNEGKTIADVIREALEVYVGDGESS